MRSVRDALNELKWVSGSLERAVIRYVSRGSPNDEAELSGAEIVHIGASFLELASGIGIPHHRVVRIEVDGVVVFERPERPTSR